MVLQHNLVLGLVMPLLDLVCVGCRLLTVVVETSSMIGGIDEIVEDEIACNVAILTRKKGKVSIGVCNGAE